jgi:DNA-binding HxlR family transcriptional regulator
VNVDEPHCYSFVADCRIRAAIDLVAHTWNAVVLSALRGGSRRPGELRTEIGGISAEVLNETLRRLEGFGLVDRRRYAEAPPRVEYQLTQLGTSLVEGPLAARGRWTLEHEDALLAARQRIEPRS